MERAVGYRSGEQGSTPADLPQRKPRISCGSSTADQILGGFLVLQREGAVGEHSVGSGASTSIHNE